MVMDYNPELVLSTVYCMLMQVLPIPQLNSKNSVKCGIILNFEFFSENFDVISNFSIHIHL